MCLGTVFFSFYQVQTLLDSVKWDDKGLAVAIAQNVDTGAPEVNKLASTSLYSLESTISQRKAELAVAESGKPSWTKKLLLEHDLLCSKIREETNELCQTLEENEDKTRTASEMGDVLYHAMVLLALKDVKMEDVLEILRRRFSQSGIEEKGSRGKQKS
ncbi:Histidine biosynthesis bifunctional protein hisIE, chloroplastic [Linum perenne]